MAINVRAFQIFYSEATRAAVDPGFEPLDNLANERPDWYEYWPMRAFFQREALDEDTLYGFFSPRFHGKTRLDGRTVREFAAGASEADVVTFSPHPCHGACFFNVFEQGANFLPGFLEVAQEVIRELNPDFRLDRLCNDSRNTVFCNYFVAKPRFWREWRALFERIFDAAEARGSRLHELLNRPVRYAKDNGETKPAQMKIMFMERVPSLLLSSGIFRVRTYAPFSMPRSKYFEDRLPDLVALDALKIAYTQTADHTFVQLFAQRRDQLLAELFPDLYG